MVSIIVSLILTVLVLGLVWWLLSLLPLPAPFSNILRVLFILLAIVLVLGAFKVVPGLEVPLIRL